MINVFLTSFICFSLVLYLIIKEVEAKNEVVLIFYYQTIILCVTFNVIYLVLIDSFNLIPLVKICTLVFIENFSNNREMIFYMVVLFFNFKFLIFLISESGNYPRLLLLKNYNKTNSNHRNDFFFKTYNKFFNIIFMFIVYDLILLSIVLGFLSIYSLSNKSAYFTVIFLQFSLMSIKSLIIVYFIVFTDYAGIIYTSLCVEFFLKNFGICFIYSSLSLSIKFFGMILFTKSDKDCSRFKLDLIKSLILTVQLAEVLVIFVYFQELSSIMFINLISK